MQFKTLSVIGLFALGAVAQGGPESPCTTTTTVRAQCCPPKSEFTSTTSVNCGGCSAIATRSTGPVCDIVCESTRTVDATTTVAVCKKSPTSSPCTITKTEQIPFGCTITKAAHTATSLSDCHGCALTTSFTNRDGTGPECPGGQKTVTAKSSTTTVTSCAPVY